MRNGPSLKYAEVRLTTVAFCVECGRDGPTIEALCQSCFAGKHAIVRAPDFVDLSRCVHCGSILLDGAWNRVDLDLALPRVLEKAIDVTDKADGHTLSHSAHARDPNAYDVTARVAARFGEVEIVEEFRTKLRIRGAVCPTCSRERGSFYASILQVRADGRDLTAPEVAAIRTFVEDAVDRARRDGEAFLAKVEVPRGGIDFYLSSNPLGRAIAREVRREFGGDSAAAPKLHTRSAGRDVYRVTYRVRLPRLRAGQTVEFRGERFTVTEVGPLVTLESADGTKRRFKLRELRRAVPMESPAQG